jgi:cytochrome P450
MLSINTPAALQSIYTSPKANVVKGDWYKMLNAAEGDWSTHSVVDKDQHNIKRRLMANAFSDNAIRGAEGYILESIKTWTDILGAPKEGSKKDEWSQGRDMTQWSTFLSFDLLSNLAFGAPLHTMSSEGKRYIPELVAGFTTFAYTVSISNLSCLAAKKYIPLFQVGYAPFVALVRPLMKTKFMDMLAGKMAQDNMRFTTFAQKTMEDRVTNDAKLRDRQDLLHYFLRAKDPLTGSTISLSSLRTEACLLIIAGSDTSAITVAALFFYLVRNPRTLAKLTAEIRSAFKDADDIKTGPKLNSLTYLRACLDETLRMNPPVGGVLTRKVLPGGLSINDLYIPGGVEVGTSAYAIHHNEEFFPEPFTFKPERWLVDENLGITPESVALAQSAFCPFSLGSRGCIGKNLAYMELSLAVARALWLYDVRGAPGDRTGEGDPRNEWGRRRRGEFQAKDRFVSSGKGPVVEFRGRAGVTG